MSGVPASETSAIAAPSASRRNSAGRALRRIVVVVGRERRGDGVAVEELSRHPRILAGDQVGAGQRVQRAQGDVAEIADRGGDDVQPRSELRHVDLPAVEDIVPPIGSRPGGLRSISLIAGSLAPLPLAVMAGRSDFIILSIRLTIRPQNDRLALPYAHRGR